MNRLLLPSTSSSPVTFWCNEELEFIEASETSDHVEKVTSAAVPLYTITVISGRGYNTDTMEYTAITWDEGKGGTETNDWSEGVAFPAGVSDFFSE